MISSAKTFSHIAFISRREIDSMDKSMSNEMDRLATLLASLIEKYAKEIELEDLPDPPRPADS